jgi:hypothetical protein
VNVANSSDPDYVAGRGIGGTAPLTPSTNGNPGTGGMIVVQAWKGQPAT